MTDRPILFSGAMIRALLDGRKTQTRRIASASNLMIDGQPIGRNPEVGKSMRWIFDSLDWSQAWVDPGPSPAGNPGPYWHVPCVHPEAGETTHRLYPKWQKGDRLWVRESFWVCEVAGHGIGVPFLVYDDEWTSGPGAKEPQPAELRDWVGTERFGKRPGIHMPRWASRITLTVSDVRVERLQDITEEDAKAEGVAMAVAGHGEDGTIKIRTCRTGFVYLWNEINGNWLDNPWICAITFSVARRNIDA